MAKDRPRQSDVFKLNRFFWKIFALWPGKSNNKYYKYYSVTYLVFTLFFYNFLLTLNLYYTPRKIDLLIREIIFNFTEIAVMFKVMMIIVMRKKLNSVFDLLNCNEFEGDDDIGRQIIEEHNSYYKKYWIVLFTLSQFSYASQVFFPLIGYFVFKRNIDLPICKYYFLSDETRENYFTIIYAYQSFGMYGHMMYNVNIDSLIAGLIIQAVAQVKVLCHHLESISDKQKQKDEVIKESHLEVIHRHVKHHEIILKYCTLFQDVISTTMFVQFGIGSGIICVIMCGLTLQWTTETLIFLVSFFVAMNLQIFVPAWLGTQLNYESQELMVAVYKGEWISKSENYKKCIKIFVERAKYPIVITGKKFIPLTLPTYISIMKTAYSCFTLVRFLEEKSQH